MFVTMLHRLELMTSEPVAAIAKDATDMPTKDSTNRANRFIDAIFINF